MRVLVAIDSFKGSLSSLQAASAVKEAVLKAQKNAEVTICPIADGGEGTVEALSLGLGGNIIEATVMGPLEENVTAKYCILRDNTAVIEMSAAAGLTLVPPDKRNPLKTTSFGVGQMIRDAIRQGCRNFIIGIGGSATNDGGVGMLSALGFDFLDKNGSPILKGAQGLEKLASISTDNVMPELKDCYFKVACDVTNPLCKENGCSAIFAAQKGATPEMIEKMDKWLENYALLSAKISKKADMNFAGAGAAGGLGFAFLSFLNSELTSGVKIILEQTKIEEKIKNADIVVTGEGRLDSQTAMGKAPIGVAKLAKKYGKKVIAFSGCISDDAEILGEHGIDAFFPILPRILSLEEAMNPDNAYNNLKNTAYQVFRLIK